MQSNKGFTLIELMIVLAILALLAAIVLFAINPAQLFARARDSQRMSDLRTLSSAINYYMVTADSPVLDGATNTKCVGGSGSTTIFATATAPETLPTGFTAWLGTTNRSTNGTDGWLKINFAAMGDSPLGQLPIDPMNKGVTATPSTFYSFACDTSLSYELNASLESAQYKPREGSDGGDLPTVYEVGTKITNLLPATTTNFYPND